MSARPAAPLTQFGKYLLDGEIATGGMSKVFRARLRGPGGFEKRLVVKQILPQLAQDPNFVSMFVQEANTLVQMSHPHIVPVYELGVVDGVYFLAMELVEGATLSEILREGPLHEALVGHFAIQICEALHYAHDRCGVIHRDVTPRNVVIDDAGHARLLDFGIAAPTDQAGRFGSVGYMSPEQALAMPVGPQSDLFSLGTLLYEALTGRPAFLRSSADKTRAALLDQAPPLVPEDVGSANLRLWVDRCLQRDPRDRPQSAREMATALRGWLASVRPEGVALELGTRAHQARTALAKPARPDAITGDQSEHTPTLTPTSGGESRTLATSPILESLLHEVTVPIARAAAAGAVPSTANGPSSPPAVPSSTPRRSFARLASLAGLGLLLVSIGLWIAARATPVPPPTATHAQPRTPAPSAPAPANATAEPLAPIEAQPPVAAPTPPVAVNGIKASHSPVDADASSPSNTEARATLVINAVPWANAKLDGRNLGATPLRRVSTEPGKHTLELDCPPLGRRASVSLHPKAGATVRVLVNLNQQPPAISVR